MLARIVYTRRDGSAAIYTPADEAIRYMASGGYWPGAPRGFLAEQIDLQVESGHPQHAVVRFVHSMQFGGCTEAEALGILRDRDCSYDGTACELWSVRDIPADRWFRNAWRRSHNGGPIGIDMKAARRIQFRKISHAADAAKASLKLERWKNRIRLATTPEELRRIWPEGLSHG